MRLFRFGLGRLVHRECHLPYESAQQTRWAYLQEGEGYRSGDTAVCAAVYLPVCLGSVR